MRLELLTSQSPRQSEFESIELDSSLFTQAPAFFFWLFERWVAEFFKDGLNKEFLRITIISRE